MEDEVFYRSPSGHGAYFAFLWGPVRADDGSVELVVGVSRDTTRRHADEEALRRSEARLRAATELVGLGVYSVESGDRRARLGRAIARDVGPAAGSPVDPGLFEAGIHPDDLPRVRDAVAACVDPAGDGRYNIEYRVVGRDDGVTRGIATAGRTTFEGGRAVGFIGAAIDVTAQRRAEAAIRASEALFRSFAQHSSNLLWIADPAAGHIIYRSPAFETIWGLSREDAPTSLADVLDVVHPDDRRQVERALATVQAGEVAQYDYRLVRPRDGTIRWLRDTSFPILDEDGAVSRIAGIAEDLTPEDRRQVYVVSTERDRGAPLDDARQGLGVSGPGSSQAPARSSTSLRSSRPAASSSICAGLGCRVSRSRASSRRVPSTLPAIVLDGPAADVGCAVAAMKAGAIDYLTVTDEESLRTLLVKAMAECRGLPRTTRRDESAAARVGRLTPREREVLSHLVDGETNKMIGQQLGISPRTVELHRAHVMNRLNATNLTELLQVALAAGIAPRNAVSRRDQKAV